MKDKNLGSVYFDKSKNKWVCYYYVHDNITNEKKRLKKRFNSESEANNFFTRFNSLGSEALEEKDSNLKELLEKILNNKLKNNIISDRQFGILSGINKHIYQESFSNKIIRDITFEELNIFLNSLTKYSDSYIKKIHNQLNDAFKYAIVYGYTNTNPMINIQKPKSTKNVQKVKSLTLEEENKLNKYLFFADIFNFPYKNVYLLILHMGLRVGEALALKLEDIDLVKNTISINKILVSDGNDKPIIKNDYQNSRTIKINKHIKEFLKQQLNIAKANPDNFLFLSRNHTLVSPGTINKLLQKTMTNLGTKNVQTQMLRYTYRDNLLKDGLKHEEIIQIMGPINFE